MKIGITSDHGGYDLKNKIIKYYRNKIEIIDFGTNIKESVDYPDYAFKLGEAINNKEIDFGISICKTGIGMCIALNKIKGIVAVPEVGEVYDATVRSIMPYGIFCEFLPGKDGLLHISEIDWKRLEQVEDSGIKEGDKIKVKLIDVDPRSGKFKLSRKVLLPRPQREENNN